MDKSDLIDAINQVLDERQRIEAALHEKHHQFIDELLEDRRIKRERNERIRQQIIGWGIITVLSGIGYGAYQLFDNAVSHGAQTHAEQKNEPHT